MMSAQDRRPPGSTLDCDAGNRFLHVIPDDKFIDEARALFEEARPGANDYILLARPGRLRHLRTFDPCRVDPDEKLRPDLLDRLPRYDAVFIHFLNWQARDLIDRAPPATRFVWIGWGGDYYHLILGRGQLLLPETRSLVASIDRRGRRKVLVENAIKGCAWAAYRPVRAARRLRTWLRNRRIGAGRPEELQLLNRIALFAPVLRDEYQALVTANPTFKPGFADWNYWTPGLAALGDAPIQGRNVLLGNSATAENNHLEAMRLIASVPTGDRNILCPLSYGDARYGDRIAAAGHRMFGSKFVALRDYMDTATYLEILRSCPIVVMNHIRQQAMGNIIMMLWMGARVFLNPQSPINREMASIGVHVHDIGGIAEFLQQPETAPTSDRIVDIRERLDRRFGRDAIMAKTRILLAQASALRHAGSTRA